MAALCGSFKPASAIDIGSIGRTYPISEPDLIEYIHKRLAAMEKDGLMQKFQKDLTDRGRAFAEKPQGRKLPRASVRRAAQVDMTLRLSADIRDAKGSLLYGKGTEVNPLKIKRLARTMCFIDGDDRDQVQWAKANCSDYAKAKIILVNGSPRQVAEEIKSRIFFDQQSYWSKRFQIAEVPATLRQVGEALYVETHPL